MRVLTLIALAVLNIFIFSLAAPRALTVSFIDVGQGDAILVTGPTGVTLLVDGGPDKSVLRGLGTALPFFDRTIDVVVATHPDADHIGGLVDVFNRYDVRTFIESGVENDTSIAAALDDVTQKENTVRIPGRAGMRLTLGGDAYADILYPNGDVSNVETNAGSIILRVVYGENEFMLTGDAPRAIEGLLVSKYGAVLQSDVLKAGHHGSKTSSNEHFVQAVAPQYVVYSRGCENRYGHPAEEVVALFQKLQIPSFDTCEEGTVTFRTNGHTLTYK